MAGATNRQLKTAGIPKAAMAQIRVHAGGHLTLKSALDVAAKHGIAIPDKAHAFMAARDLKARKVALQAAGARRSANVTRAISDAAKVALAARKEAARQKSVSRPVDAAMGRDKDGAMGKIAKHDYTMTVVGRQVRVFGTPLGVHPKYGSVSRQLEWKAVVGDVIIDGHTTKRAAVAAATKHILSTRTEAERRALAVDIEATRRAAEGRKNRAIANRKRAR